MTTVVMKMVTVKDIYTNFIGAYPVDSRSEINVRNSLKFFVGGRKIKLKLLCGDNAEEFEKAANALEFPSITPFLTASRPMPLWSTLTCILRIKLLLV